MNDLNLGNIAIFGKLMLPRLSLAKETMPNKLEDSLTLVWGKLNLSMPLNFAQGSTQPVEGPINISI